MVTSCFSGIQRVLTAQSELLQMAQQLAHAIGNGHEDSAEKNALGSHLAIPSASELSRLLPELAAPAARLPFNIVCRGPQRYEWAQISLSQVKAVKRCFGATVNDVFLSVIASALRRYAEMHDILTAGRLLRVIVPVSIRGRDNASELGNRITFLPVSIPFTRSPGRLIATVRERTTFLKGSHVAELVGFAGTLLGTIPPAVQALLAPIASSLPIPAGNIICTQVPGPREPLYLMGHQLVSCYPYVPIGGEFGLNCAVLTYNDVAHFGFSADVHAVPDLSLMPKLLLQSFEELKKVAGVKRRRTVRIAKPVAATQAVHKSEEEKVLAAAGD
jgi:diacylglycerol O-acyltransferase